MNDDCVISFSVPGKPASKGRPRFKRGGRVYTDAKTAAAEAAIKVCAQQNTIYRFLEGPVEVDITAYFAVPSSWTKKRKAAMIGQLHFQRPDADNIGKAVLDAINGVCFTDDAQVSRITTTKRWAEHPGTHVTIRRAVDL